MRLNPLSAQGLVTTKEHDEKPLWGYTYIYTVHIVGACFVWFRVEYVHTGLCMDVHRSVHNKGSVVDPNVFC